MSKTENIYNYTNIQAFLLVTLRVLLGWYFLYEGITKIANPDWTSMGYLMDSKGWFSGIYHSMAANVSVVNAVDFLNKWGLTLIGMGLITGLLTQLALIFGMLILAMYYLSHPALASVTYLMPMEGSYLWVNKTLIEIFAMAVLLAFPTGRMVGLDRLIAKWTKK
jgi:thiosulfate dehydrogenase [quinone] large subunit